MEDKGRGYRGWSKVEATEDGQRSGLQMGKGRGYRWAKVEATEDGQRSRLQMVKGRDYSDIFLIVNNLCNPYHMIWCLEII
jgi:hypothetical protein